MTGFEPATLDVTRRCSNQLSYMSTKNSGRLVKKLSGRSIEIRPPNNSGAKLTLFRINSRSCTWRSDHYVIEFIKPKNVIKKIKNAINIYTPNIY